MTAGVSGSKQPDDEEDLANFVDRWTDSIVTNDVQQMAQFVTDDWLLIDKPGAITRDAFHGAVASGMLRHSAMTHEILDVKRLAPGVVVIRTHGRNTAHFQGDMIEADEWTTNILIKGPEGWRCTLTQLTPRLSG